MAKVTYLPKVGDPAETTVYRHSFTDGVPVDVPEEWLAHKLSQNSWFHIGDEPAPVSERAAHVAKEAREAAAQARALADQIDPEPRGEPPADEPPAGQVH